MKRQELKKKDRVPVQFYVDPADKARAYAVLAHFGEISEMARTGFLEQIEKRERANDLQIKEEKKAS